MLLVALPVAADVPAVPGTYHGWVRVDRWGNRWFQYGRQAWALSDEVFLGLEGMVGKAVEMDVTGVARTNDGRPILAALSHVEVEHAPLELGLELRFDPRHQQAGQTLLATVRVRNLGTTPMDVHRKPLRLIVARRTEIGLTFPEEEALGASPRPLALDVAAAATIEPSRAGAIVVREIPCVWRNASAFGTLQAGAMLEQTFAFGEDLPTGELEVFAVWGDHDDPHMLPPMSAAKTFELYAG